MTSLTLRVQPQQGFPFPVLCKANCPENVFRKTFLLIYSIIQKMFIHLFSYMYHFNKGYCKGYKLTARWRDTQARYQIKGILSSWSLGPGWGHMEALRCPKCGSSLRQRSKRERGEWGEWGKRTGKIGTDRGGREEKEREGASRDQTMFIGYFLCARHKFGC